MVLHTNDKVAVAATLGTRVTMSAAIAVNRDPEFRQPLSISRGPSIASAARPSSPSALALAIVYSSGFGETS